ncbi:haloacid dehalogenase type II [Cognatishimia sp. WU-CL00825]|uniref:haloacid dehalogenase type II n=1 Tax=Cognatishimia sp. WU-CL00825 TaxID=3127658 RepID=UPI003365A14D
MSDALGQVKAIIFDVFGTVVDWRGSILRELEEVGQTHGIDANWSEFADKWRAGYNEGSRAFLLEKQPWKKADLLHWERLNLLKANYGLDRLSEAELRHLNKAWHRLTPWKDSVKGLTRLKQKYMIGTLSNGDNGLLVHMAKNAGLPWDVIMGAENFGSYKPDPKVYLGAVDLLGYETHEVMVAACHLSDLYNARKNGLRAGFIVRPDEFGDSDREPDLVGDERIDVHATDFIDFAEKMGA